MTPGHCKGPRGLRASFLQTSRGCRVRRALDAASALPRRVWPLRAAQGRWRRPVGPGRSSPSFVRSGAAGLPPGRAQKGNGRAESTVCELQRRWRRGRAVPRSPARLVLMQDSGWNGLHPCVPSSLFPATVPGGWGSALGPARPAAPPNTSANRRGKLAPEQPCTVPGRRA